jgi:glyoxylase-like metal-dependent hydrolase (beta-lactamase superfamily II)
MKRTRGACILLTALVALGAVVPAAQQRGAPVTSPRIYIFDAGHIRGLDPKLFNFTREELKEVDFVNTAYLIVHPKGTLMFDVGAVPDSHFTADGAPVTEGIMSATRPLKPQLAEAGYTPADITHLAMSHYHSDHTANANDFAGATWIVQKAERDFMLADTPQGIIQPDHYSALRTARTRILDNEDLDVFGDGTVVVVSTPGHTPGHQVLFVQLARRGPVLLGGELSYRELGQACGIEESLARKRVSRALAKLRVIVKNEEEEP